MLSLTRRMVIGPAGALAVGALSWLAVAPISTAVAAPQAPAAPGVRGCDIDGDSYGDLVVGAAREGSSDDGRLFLRFGSPTGLGDRGQEVAPLDDAQTWFGTTMACGDFDADGHDDLAVGAWGTGFGKASGAGAVTVYYGAATGIDTNRTVYLREGTTLPGKPQDFDFLGRSLAVGDFNGDTVDDLAIGAPNEHVRVSDNCCGTAGAVYEIHGVAGQGLETSVQQWTQNSPGVPGKVQRLDDFGQTLAAGDFDGDGRDDLAVGTPSEATAGHRYVGVVTVLPGSPSGLTGSGASKWSQATDGVKGEPELRDGFGRALAAGDLGGGLEDDLAIGVGDDGGSVQMLPGSASGLTAAGNTIWSQARPGLPGGVWHRGGVGAELAGGDLDGDGNDDLTVLTRHEANGEGQPTGAVTTLLGAPQGLSAEGATRVTAADLNVPTTRPNVYFGYGMEIVETGGPRPTVVVGAPKADPVRNGTTLSNAGVVALLPGGPKGLSASNAQLLTEDSSAWSNPVASSDWFGTGIAS
jgi:hypothetical protein